MGPDAGFTWRSLGPAAWPELRRRLVAAAAQGSSGEPTSRLIPQAVFHKNSEGLYQGSVLAPNGRIYGIPRMAPQIVELRPRATADPLASSLGPDLGGADNWYGGALAWDGTIYASASDGAYALHVDPEHVSLSKKITSAKLSLDHDKWVGLRVAPNGKLYACPRSDTKVLEIDPNASSGVTVRRVGPDLGSALHKWWGGVLAPNGKIYCIPLDDDRILEIDPEDLTASGIRRVGPSLDEGDPSENRLKWWGGALAPNGRIYAAPGHDGYVLEIRPLDIAHSGRIGPEFGTTSRRKWCGVTLAPNGKLYAVPDAAGRVLEIDPSASMIGIREVGMTLPSTERGGYFGSTLAPNGKLYALPWQNTTEVLEIDPHAKGSFDMDVLLNGHLNGY